MKCLFSWSLFPSAISVIAAADESVTKPPGRLPNIVIILADDLGYGDPHCYNPKRGKIPTPHIDKLAAQGIRFTDAHSSSAVCSPSRYTLLTGRYHWRTRLQAGVIPPWGPPLIDPGCLTLGTLARQKGYSTAAVGKWHLGWNWPVTASQRDFFNGFGRKVDSKIDTPLTDAHRAAWREVFSQPIGGGPATLGFDTYFGVDVPNWPPFCFIEKDRTSGIPSTFLPANKLKRRQANMQGPALPDWSFEPILLALADRACDVIGQAAKQPQPFLLYLALTSPHYPLAPNAEWRGKSGLESPVADFIMETDAVVGRVLEAIRRAGVDDNTLVLFTSDNGFDAKNGAAHLEKRGHFPSGPLRGYKWDAWEGGHRVPFIVRWPCVVKSGTVCHQLVHQADLMATLAEIFDVPLMPEAGVDSFSLLPLLRGNSKPIRRHAVSCGAWGVPGFRNDEWKLILAEKAELYNLAKDIGETTDLAAQEPERVKEMQERFEQIILNGRSTPGPRQTNDVAVKRGGVAMGNR